MPTMPALFRRDDVFEGARSSELQRMNKRLDQLESDVQGIMKVNSLVRERFDAFDALSSESDSESKLSELPEVIPHEPLNIPEVLPIPPVAAEATPNVCPSVHDTENPYELALATQGTGSMKTRKQNQKAIFHDLKFRYQWERENGRGALLHRDLKLWLQPKYGVEPQYLGKSWWANIRDKIQDHGYVTRTRKTKYGLQTPSISRRNQRYNRGDEILWAQASRTDIIALGGNKLTSAWFWLKPGECWKLMRSMNIQQENTPQEA